MWSVATDILTKTHKHEDNNYKKEGYLTHLCLNCVSVQERFELHKDYTGAGHGKIFVETNTHVINRYKQTKVAPNLNIIMIIFHTFQYIPHNIMHRNALCFDTLCMTGTECFVSLRKTINLFLSILERTNLNLQSAVPFCKEIAWVPHYNRTEYANNNIVLTCHEIKKHAIVFSISSISWLHDGIVQVELTVKETHKCGHTVISGKDVNPFTFNW